MALDKSTLDAYIQALYDAVVAGELSSADYQLIINFILSNGEPATDPRDLFQFRRGDEADLPTLAQGEPAITLDTEAFFIGGLGGNIPFPSRKELDSHFVNALYPPTGLDKAKADDTDTLPELQAMLDYLETNGGGVLYLAPDSTFGVSGNIIVPSKVAIVGGGVTTVVHQLDSSGIKTFINKNRQTGPYNPANPRDYDVTLKNFKIINQGDVATSDNDQCIDMYYVTRMVVENMWLENCKSHGIYSRFNSDVKLQDIYIKDTREQGIAVTYGDDITIRNIRGEGLMLHLVDIEPNAGDIVTNLTIENVKTYDDNQALLLVYDAGGIGITGANVSNIETTVMISRGVKNLNVNNVICRGVAGLDSFVLQTCENVNITNVNATIADDSDYGFKTNDVSEGNVSNVIINSSGNTTIGMDNIALSNIKFFGLNFVGIFGTGVRHRNSDDNMYFGIDIQEANTGVNLVPSTSNGKTSLQGISVKTGTTGVLASGTNSDIYISGDLSGCVTAIEDSGNSGVLSMGSVVGASRDIRATAVPTSGDFTRGDIIYHKNPSAGGFIGWVCTLSGNPGTWREFGAIELT